MVDSSMDNMSSFGVGALAFSPVGDSIDEYRHHTSQSLYDKRAISPIQKSVSSFQQRPGARSQVLKTPLARNGAEERHWTPDINCKCQSRNM